jgi:dihydropteroate synthase
VEQDTINIRGTLFDFSTPRVMGVLNVTSDSFFDGGAYSELTEALVKVDEMLNDGADIIDIGGASSRPGAKIVTPSEEQGRVLPIIEAVSKQYPNAIISIDTNCAQTAELAVRAGAHIVNDISAGDDDEDMLRTVGKLKVPFIAMHKQGSPSTMQDNPTYNDVVVEVTDYFLKKQAEYKCHGILDVIIDPGFGFGKTVNHNYQLLKNLNALKTLTKSIVLVGVSRKSMINKVLHISPVDALNGTTVLNSWALQNGASVLRVHDVKEAKEAITLYKTYTKA